MSKYMLVVLAAVGVAVVGLGVSIAAEKDPAAKLVVWDGEQAAKGSGWANPENEDNTVKPGTNEAHSGKAALVWKNSGDTFVGMGWNWKGLHSDDASDDISKYDNLVFWFKFDGQKPAELSIFLMSNNGKASFRANILVFAPEAFDGKWHEVVIPIDTFTFSTFGTTEFDATKAREFGIRVLSAKDPKFTVYLDDIGFDNRKFKWPTKTSTSASAPTSAPASAPAKTEK